MTAYKVFTGATLSDGTGAKPEEDASILIEGERIKDVGKGLDAPRDAEGIDAAGRTLMPGLIDSYVHLCSNGDSDILRIIHYPMGMLQLFGYRNALNELEAGFTTVRDMGVPHGFAFSLRQVVGPGKLADIIVVDGDPLKDIKVLEDKAKILLVMKGGVAEVNRGI